MDPSTFCVCVCVLCVKEKRHKSPRALISFSAYSSSIIIILPLHRHARRRIEALDKMVNGLKRKRKLCGESMENDVETLKHVV